MIDGTEKPKIPSKFAKRAERYNEFGSNPLALTKFERCQQYTIIDNSYSDFNDCILTVFDNWRHAWERRDLKKMAEDFTTIERERED